VGNVMAKVQLSVEELLQLARGEMPVEEIKQQLAKGMLEVWNSPETQSLIQAEAERLAQVKIERVMESSVRVVPKTWNRPEYLEGWAVEVLREEVRKRDLRDLAYVVAPEIERVAQEIINEKMGDMVTKALGNLIISKQKEE
jgi:hypothetical protein